MDIEFASEAHCPQPIPHRMWGGTNAVRSFDPSARREGIIVGFRGIKEGLFEKSLFVSDTVCVLTDRT